MEQKNGKKYFIGLDIGTNSVGWAVTDENYDIMRAKGQKLWGVRLFEEAQAAKDRRLKRNGRRGLVRQKLRKEWLNEIFAPEIAKVDGNFLQRLKYSNLFEDDKYLMDANLVSKDSLFGIECMVEGEPYTDKEYFDEFPTIYHLRNHLLGEPAKDIRLLYLAVRNLLKVRGNFLHEGDLGSGQSIQAIAEKIVKLSGELESGWNFKIEPDFEQQLLGKLAGERVEEALVEETRDEEGEKEYKKVTKNDLKIFAKKMFGATGKKEKALVESFISGKINLNIIFELDEKIDDGVIDYTSEDFDAKMQENEGVIGETGVLLISAAKDMYCEISLKKFLGKHEYVCQAMLEKFELHKEQLKEFKAFMGKYFHSKFNEMFRESKEKCANYVAYAGRAVNGGSKKPVAERCTREDFYKYVKSVINNKENKSEFIDEDFEQRKKEILALIEEDKFLPKQRSKENAVLPNGLLKKELLKILEVSAQKFAFLNEKDENGLTATQKIEKIFTFRIPYFVGPLGGEGVSKNAWAKKIVQEELRPWNLKEIVDFDQAEDDFIRRMTNKCTYLKDKDVLPKNSLLYERFRVLNELNKLTINGEAIDVDLKQKIFSGLFMRKKKVTIKMLKVFVGGLKGMTEKDAMAMQIGGIDKEFKNNLSSYVMFANSAEFGEDFVRENEKLIENVILWHTVMSNREDVKQRAEKLYPNLTDAQLKAIKGFSFSGWGTLSREFLSETLFANKRTGTGEATTVINELWSTNFNLQQVLARDNYTLREKLDEQAKGQIEELNKELLNELYCSPAVKRGVWQALRIVEEIKQTLGQKPEKIFVEVTRHDEEKGEKGRKLSRKDYLNAKFEDEKFKDILKDQIREYDEVCKELGKRDNLALRSEKLYLYFLQLGRCAYTGQKIDINELLQKEGKYDVDHIIPQAIMVDDSLNNKVLVLQEYNKNKGDNYPIAKNFPDWVVKMKNFWKLLLDLGLMTAEKFQRLTRQTFTPEDRADFVNRQLVETSQANKTVIDILKRYVDNPNFVVYSKAKHVTDFRHKYDILKSREVNDMHHAQDAYLNVVVGDVLFNRYAQNNSYFHENKDDKNKGVTKKRTHVFDREIKATNSDKIVWKGKEDVKRVREIALRHDMLFSYMPIAHLNGKFYKETVHKSRKNNPKTEAKLGLKGDLKNPLSNIERYGGYSDIINAYFMVIESDDKKGERKTTIEFVPTYIYQKYKNSPTRDEDILNFVAQENGLVNPRVVCDRLNLYTTVRLGDGEYLLSGKSNDTIVMHNFNQWHIAYEDLKYVRALEKYQSLIKEKKDSALVEENGKVVLSKGHTQETEIALSKEKNEVFYDMLIEQLQKKIYERGAIASLSKNLIENKENFLDKDVLTQSKVLWGVVQRLKRGAQLADLHELNNDLGKNLAKLRIGKNVTGKGICVIERSVTGLYKKVIKI